MAPASRVKFKKIRTTLPFANQVSQQLMVALAEEKPGLPVSQPFPSKPIPNTGRRAPQPRSHTPDTTHRGIESVSGSGNRPLLGPLFAPLFADTPQIIRMSYQRWLQKGRWGSGKMLSQARRSVLAVQLMLRQRAFASVTYNGLCTGPRTSPCLKE